MDIPELVMLHETTVASDTINAPVLVLSELIDKPAKSNVIVFLSTRDAVNSSKRHI